MAIIGLLKENEGQDIKTRLLRRSDDATFWGWFFTFVFHSLIGPFRIILYPVWAFLPVGSLSRQSYYRLLSVIITLPVATLILLAYLSGGTKSLSEISPSKSLDDLAVSLRAMATASDTIRESGFSGWFEEVKKDLSNEEEPPPTGVSSLGINLGYRDFILADGSTLRAHLITVTEENVDLWLQSGSREQRPLSDFGDSTKEYLEAVRYQLGYRD